MAKPFKIISSPVFSWSKSLVYSLLCYQDKNCRPLEEEITSIINNSVKIENPFLMTTQHLPCCISSPLLCIYYRHTNRPFLSSLQKCSVFEGCSHIFSWLYTETMMQSFLKGSTFLSTNHFQGLPLQSVKLKPYQHQIALFNRTF